MKILFKNNTNYTKENYNAFIEFHKNKYGIKTLLKLAVIILCVCYIMIINIINRNYKALLAIVLIVLFLYLYNKISAQRENNNNKKNNRRKFSFYFYERYIKIKCGKKFDRIIYLNIHKVFETDKYFFLYTDENHSLILNKEGFEIGTPEEFSKFIKKKCPLKFKKEKSKE